MRSLRVGTLEFVERDEPSEWESSDYAILSHVWDTDEVLYEDMQFGPTEMAASKMGYAKIYSASLQAGRDALNYLWADTCCIDKRSSAELQEAINSMYRWYALAKVCYVYLSDVGKGHGWVDQFRRSIWFHRAWTLQELLAPADVRFYDSDWKFLGTLPELVKIVSATTAIDVRLLTHKRQLSTYSIAQRMSWAANRQATRIEDIAYSLLGIFDVNMTMLYGEGTKAFRRLQQEIMRISTDHSIFAWDRSGDASGYRQDCVQHSVLREVNDGTLRGVLAESPAAFKNCGRVGRLSELLPGSYHLTNRGLDIPLPLVTDDIVCGGYTLALLDCYNSGPVEKPLYALELRPLPTPLKAKHYNVEPGLFARHATAAYMVMGIRHLCQDGFDRLAEKSRAEKIALFSGEEPQRWTF